MSNIPSIVQLSHVQTSNISVILKEFVQMHVVELVHVEVLHVIVGLDIAEQTVLYHHDYSKLNQTKISVNIYIFILITTLYPIPIYKRHLLHSLNPNTFLIPLFYPL